MDDGAHGRARGGHTAMRKRKKFHEVRYPQKRVSNGRNADTAPSGTPTAETKDIEAGSMPPWEDADTTASDAEEFRTLRINGINAPDRADVIEVENGRKYFDGSWIGRKIDDNIIILTDIETGFFRECVEADKGGGWYGNSNSLDLEKYGLGPHDRIRTEHIPQVEEAEREDLLVRLIYRKAYHRATAHIAEFGKSTEILVQECWFKCYLPWPCLERDIPRSVEVANNILQELEPEVNEQVKIVQPKIKAEMKLRKASGEYDLTDLLLVPDGVPQWTMLPKPSNRDELNELEAFYEEDRAADRRVKEKQDARDQGKIGPMGSYSFHDVWDRETTLEDLQKRVAARGW